MAKPSTKGSVEKKKYALGTSIALHQIRKPLQRTLPWLTPTNKGTSYNASASESQTTIAVSESENNEMMDDDIYGSQFPDGVMNYVIELTDFSSRFVRSN